MCAPNRSDMGSRLLEDAAAVAALKKAVQSSPPRFPGSKHSPIELDSEMSPAPTRRLLFLSPRRAGEAKLLDPSVENDGRPWTSDNGGQAVNTLAQDDKENQPPTFKEANDEIDELFEPSESAGTPRTPKSAARTEDSFKTSSNRRSRRQALSPNHFLAGGSRASENPTTPARVVADYDMEHMTPFTAQLTQLMSEAQYLPGKNGAGVQLFEDQLGAAQEHGLFAFVDFDGHDMDMGAAAPMRSSPALFSLYEDPTVAAAADAPWDEGMFLENSIDAFLGRNS